MEYYLQLEIWKGNIGGALQMARDREELSDWLVAMAPLASYDTWLVMCEEYSHQLEDDGQYHKAASYLLACHKVYDAIELFKRHKLYKESVALARVRLSPLDPVLEDLYMEWAQQLMKDGSYEQAAKCYLAMKQIQDAAQLLVRRNDQSTLKTATHMTLLANEKHQSLLYAQRVLHQYISKHEWKEGYMFLKEHEMLKMLIPFVSMHELMMKEIETLAPGVVGAADPACYTVWADIPPSGAAIPDFMLDVMESDPVLPWKPYMIGEHSFPHHVLRIWFGNLDVPMDMESLHLMYRTLTQLQSGRQSHIDPQQLVYQVCMDLTLSLLALLISETSSAISHLLQAVAGLHTAGQFRLMEAVCQLMLPLGPKYLLKLQQEATALRVLISMESHLDIEGASNAQSFKRYLSEIKDDDGISNGGLRCRELDCLRAYHYLAVLHYLQECYNSSVHVNKGELESPVACSSQVTPDAGVKAESTVSCVTGETHSVQSVTNSVPTRDVVKENTSENSEDASLGKIPTDHENGGTGSGLVVSDSVTVESGSAVSESALTSVSTYEAHEQKLMSEPIRDGNQNVSPKYQDGRSASSVQSSTLTISKLQQISRGLLWDIQAKRSSLTETLGYIHKAISKHLLTDKSRDGKTVILERDIHVKGDNSCHTHKHVCDNGMIEEADSTNQTDDSVFGEHAWHSGISRSLKSKPQPDIQTIPGHDPMNLMDMEMVAMSGSDPISKSRKVLWEDEPHICEKLDSGPRKASCVLNPATYINVPDEWYGMPVDEKYFRPYVTMAVLREEQEYAMHELKRVPDSSQVLFPNPLDSVPLLLDVCNRCKDIYKVEKRSYTQKLISWGLHFAVTTSQRTELNMLDTEPEKESEV